MYKIWNKLKINLLKIIIVVDKKYNNNINDLIIFCSTT